MPIAIRRADLVADRSVLIQSLQRYLTPLSDSVRFDWLYRDNPSGQAQAWIAWDTEQQDIVGVAAAFPRCMYIDGREEFGWVLGDFCIAEGYRSLGPALQLQRACLETINAGSGILYYDFPSAAMLAVYRRLGTTAVQQMLRLAKPLRVDRKIGGMIRPPLLARGLTSGGNLLLGLRGHLQRSDATLTISIHEGLCDQEFSHLAQQLSGRCGVCIQRSAAYLNWRYRTNPLCRFELLTARRHGKLLAYLVFSHDAEDAIVADLFGVEDASVITDLIDRAVAMLRQRGLMTVSIPLCQSHPWIRLLRRRGFRVRDASPAIISALPYATAKQISLDGLEWYFMHGDRDS